MIDTKLPFLSPLLSKGGGAWKWPGLPASSTWSGGRTSPEAEPRLGCPGLRPRVLADTALSPPQVTKETRGDSGETSRATQKTTG